MKKKVLFILIILLTIMGILGISYASWLFTSKQRNFNTLGSKCFELTMTNESEGINLSKAYPISDEEGLSTTGYTFTIKNTCNTHATYEVNLEDMLVEEKRLSGEYIKVSINDGTPVNLKELEERESHIEGSDKSYELTSGSLGPEEETTYTIKLWMDESTPAIEETMNATFLSKISIEAGYTPEENLENEILVEAKSITESLNNKSEIFEITGTSTNYDLIEYSLDKSHWSRIESPSKNVTITQEFIDAGKYTIYVRDEVGNKKSIEIETTKLDKKVPEIQIEETDNQENVELHITFTDNEGLDGYAITESSEEPAEWTSIEGKETTIEYTLTENTTYYIWVKDSVGNISYQKYSTDTIDTQAPELEITNTLTDWGVKDTITIKATDDVVGISGVSISTIEGTYNWEVVENTLNYETTKEVNENGTYYISVRDAYGHITTKSIVIDKVDNILPRIEQLTSDSEWNIINQITGSLQDNESGLSGYQITKEKIEPEEYIEINGTSYELNYEVSENGTYYIWVKDSVGNVYQTEIEVTKIDVTAPVLSSITNSSNGSWAQSITLNWNIEESGSGISKVEYSTDNNIWNELSKEKWYGFTNQEERNDTIYIRVTDNVGNVSNIESTGMKIDRTAPVISNIETYYQLLGSTFYKCYGYASDAGIDGTWVANTNDPQIDFKDVSHYTNISGVYIELETAIEKDINIAVFYANNGENYTEDNVTNVVLKAGEKSILIDIPKGNYSQIRFDIGNETNLSYKINYLAVKADSGIYHNEDILFQLTTTDEKSNVKKYYYSYDQQTWYEDFEYAIENENIRKRFSVQRNQQIYFKAEDNAGNSSDVISSWARIDRTNPTAKISASVSGNSIRVSASGSFDNESGIKNYQYSRDNSTWYTSTSDSYTFTGLADGTYTVYVKVTDNSGRTSIVSTSVTVAYVNVYIASSGNDTTGDGSSASPYATLGKASDQVADGGNILLLSDITLNNINYLDDNKSITLKSNESNIYTIYRDTTDTLLYFARSIVTVENIKIDGKNLTSQESMITVSESEVHFNQNVTIANAYSENTNYSGLAVANNSTVIIDGAIFIGNKSSFAGAAISISDNCTCTIISGTITENTSQNGSIFNNGTLNIQGGSFYNNTAVDSGGVLWNNDTVYITGGEMYSNTAGLYGGAIYNAYNAYITMTAGTIRNNHADVNGGGINLGNYENNFIFNGGNIINNTALHDGGGIYIENGATYTYISGTLSGNSPNDYQYAQ